MSSLKNIFLFHCVKWSLYFHDISEYDKLSHTYQRENTALYLQIAEPTYSYCCLVWYIWENPGSPAKIDPPIHTA